MLKRTSNSLRHVQLTKISLALLISLVCSLWFVSTVFAQDVNLNVEVKQRKPTDTINDFQLSPSPSVTSTGKVLGAQSERTPQNSRSKNLLILLLIINPLFII